MLLSISPFSTVLVVGVVDHTPTSVFPMEVYTLSPDPPPNIGAHAQATWWPRIRNSTHKSVILPLPLLTIVVTNCGHFFSACLGRWTRERSYLVAEHPDTLRSMANLARTYYSSQGKVEMRQNSYFGELNLLSN